MDPKHFNKVLCLAMAVVVLFTSVGFVGVDAAPDLLTQIYEKSYKELTAIQKSAFDNSLLIMKPKLVQDPVGQLSSAYIVMVSSKTDPKVQLVFAAWAAKQHPESVTLLNNLGFALSAVKDHPNSIEVLKLALKVEPKSLETMVNLGNVYLDTDKDEDAKAEYEKALAIDNEHFKAWEGLYAYYMKKHDLKKAMEIISKIKPPGFIQRGKQDMQQALDAVPESAKLETVKEGESLDSSQSKIDKMAEKKPINLAPVVEAVDPALAAKIRSEMENLEVSVIVPDKPFVFNYSNLQSYYIYSNAYMGETATSDEANKPNIDPSIMQMAEKLQGLSESEIEAMANEYVKGIQETLNKYNNINMNDMAEVTRAMKDIKMVTGKDMFEQLKVPSEKASVMQQLGVEEKKGTVTNTNYNNYVAHKKDIHIHFKNLITRFDNDREAMKKRYEKEMDELIEKQGDHDDGRIDCSQCVSQRNKLREKYLKEFGEYVDQFYRKYVKKTMEEVENSQALYIKNMGNSKLKNMEGEQMKAELNAFLNFFAKAEAPIDGYETASDEARQQLEDKIEEVKAQVKQNNGALPPLKNYEDTQRSLLEKIYEDVKFEGAAGLAKLKYENAEIKLELNDPFSNRYMDFSASLKDLSVSMTEGEGYEVSFKVAEKNLVGDAGLEAKVGYSNRGVGQKTTLYFDDSLNVSDAQITSVPSAQGVSTEVSLFDVGVEGSAKIETTAEGTSSFQTGIKISAKDFQLWDKQYKEELAQ